MLSVYLSMLGTDEEKETLTRLYNKYEQLMYRTAFGILRNRHNAEDVVHDAFMRIIKNFSKFYFDFDMKTEALVVIIVRNLSYNLLKKEKIRASEDLTEYIAEDRAAENEYRRLENLSAKELIETLPDELKEVIVLRFIHELDVKTISASLGLAEQTIYARIRRAREKMKEYIDRTENSDEEIKQK